MRIEFSLFFFREIVISLVQLSATLAATNNKDENERKDFEKKNGFIGEFSGGRFDVLKKFQSYRACRMNSLDATYYL